MASTSKKSTKKIKETKQSKTEKLDNKADKLAGKGVDQVLHGIDEKEKQRIEAVIKKLEKTIGKYKDAVLSKFDKYIMGIALLPQNKEKKDELNTFVLVDDSDTKRMSKYELKDKISLILEEEAKKIDDNIKPQIWLLSDLWQNLYDGKYEVLKDIAMSTFFHDTGMMAALKIGEVHKEMVLKKFEKYIVSYVLVGSLVQGRATKDSDIDVFIVIDDTDVKKMTRAELKDKLRSIIISMGFEAGELTGIKNKLNIQTYILTDFWEYMKEANPIIFTFLRDGIPFYDRGIFMPWKQLLKMGRIKPSKEAIDMFMSTGEQMLSRMKYKIRDIGLEDCFWATTTPSQAALMLYGLPPPTPKETSSLLRQIFVKKEKILEEKYVKMFENILKIRKDIEHGTKKDITGTEVDKLIKDSEDYLARLKKLFDQINDGKEKENLLHLSDGISHVARDVLRSEGINSVKDAEMINVFQKLLVDSGKMPKTVVRDLKKVIDAPKIFTKEKLDKSEIHKVGNLGHQLMRQLTEHIQRTRTKELEKVRIRIKYGKKFGEVILLGNEAFIIVDIDAEKREYQKAKINPAGSLINIKKSNVEDFEKAITSNQIIPRAFIKEPLFEDLKELFGKEMEILLNY